MRKIIIGILFFWICDMNAQSIRLLENDPLWMYCFYSYFTDYLEGHPHPNCEAYYWFAIGDTEEIDGKVYTKLYWKSPPEPESRVVEPGRGYRFMIGIREDGGRILVNYEKYKDFLQIYNNASISGDPNFLPYILTDDGEMIIYDFNMQVGDKFNSVPGFKDISVADIAKVTTKDGVERKLLILNNGLKVLEGIGCINSRGMFLNYLNPINYREDHFWLNVAFISNFVLSQESIFTQTIEDIAADHVGIEGVKMDGVEDTFAPLYDLLGRKMTGVPEPGIYIRNKKKVLIDKND